jgi:hypothetical protein
MASTQEARAGTRVGRVRAARKNWKRETSLLLLVVILPLVLLNGCAGVVNASKTQPTPTASFQVSLTSVSFGKVPVGKATSQSLAVTNNGNIAVNITKATLSNPQFSLSGMTLPMALGTGQAGTFSVFVDPTAAGSVTGTLTLQGDGGSSPAVVNLSATADPQPQLSLSSSAVSFGSVSVGSTGTSSLTISNTGTADLSVSVLTLSGVDFWISGITTPKTISAGQNAPLTLMFKPTVAGAVSGSLTITSNDPTTPTAVVSLSGTGSSTAVGQLSPNPASVSFGNVSTSSSASQQITLTNTGNAAAHISSIAVSGTGFSLTGVSTPATVAASQTLSFTAKFAPAAVGSVTGKVTVTSDASGSPLTINLSGVGVQAGLSVSPATFNFGSVVDGQTKTQAFTLTNNGTATLTITQVTASGAGYSVSGLTTPATVAPGQSTSVTAQFSPTTAGALPGTVSISSNAPGSPAKVSLTGTGVAATVTMTPTPSSVPFGNVKVGSSGSQSVSIKNSGNTSVTISQVTVSAKDVSVSGITTPVTLTPSQTTSMTVSFSPTTTESVSGNVTVSSTQGASAVIPVTGTGVQAALSITPASFSFGNVAIGTTDSQTIRLSNTGTAALTVSQVSVTGSAFSTTGLTLPLTLNPGQASTFNAQFSPTSTGGASGSLTITSNAPGSPATVALTGTGVAATLTLSLSSSSFSFGNVDTGSSSTQTETITNTGNANVQITGISVSGSGYSLTGAGTPVGLSAGQKLTFSVIFSPTNAGSATGAVTVTSNATGSPATISLSGTGVTATSHSVALTWNASTSTVSGYNVYRSTTSGTGYVKQNNSLVSSLAYTDSSVQNSTTYYYVTTAVDSSGTESLYSNEAQAIIP